MLLGRFCHSTRVGDDMAPVIRIAEGITEVTQHDLAELRRPALVEPLKSERIFLHIDDTALLQEMIIAMHRDTIVLPHTPAQS